MKNDHYLYKMSDQKLAQFRSKLITEATELGWKADKTSYRLTNRLEREAKRHAALEPTKKLLADALIIRETLLPLGESDALQLVENQLQAFEEKINNTMNKYRLLSDEEIALKEMQLLLMRKKVEILHENVVAVEDEMRARASVKEEPVNVQLARVEYQEEKEVPSDHRKTQSPEPSPELILYSKEGIKLKLLPRVSAFLGEIRDALREQVGWNSVGHSPSEMYIGEG